MVALGTALPSPSGSENESVLVALMIGLTTGASAGSKRAASNFSAALSCFFVALAGAVARSVAPAIDAIGAIRIMKESKQAVNTLAWLGVWGIDWCMNSPRELRPHRGNTRMSWKADE